MDTVGGAVVEEPRRRVIQVELDLVDSGDNLEDIHVSIRTLVQLVF